MPHDATIIGKAIPPEAKDFISHTASFAEINEVLDSYHEPDRIRTVLRF